MTNSLYFELHCTMLDHIAIINRMAQTMLKERGLADAPVWEKEKELDKWLREPFDQNAWSRAATVRSIPVNIGGNAGVARTGGHKIA